MATNNFKRRWGSGPIGRIYYIGKDDDGVDIHALHLYSRKESLRRLPNLVADLAEPDPSIFTHYKGEKGGWITTFSIKKSPAEVGLFLKRQRRDLKGRLEYRDKVMSGLGTEVDRAFNIKAVHRDLGSLLEKHIQAQRDDIFTFNKGRPSKITLPIDSHYRLVDKIAQPIIVKRKSPAEYACVKQAKGFWYDICELDIGGDTSRGCPANTTPEGLYAPDGRCGYCYAHQNGLNFLTTVFKLDEGSLTDRIEREIYQLTKPRGTPINIRLGQTVEVNVPSTLKDILGEPDNLKIFLNSIAWLRKKYDLRVAMPTKVLEFDEDSARLLREANATVLASIGYQELEEGMLAHGSTVNKRLDGILDLAKQGITGVIYIATDITRGQDAWQPDAKQAFEFFQDHSDLLYLQLLDIRIPNKRVAPIIGGAEWETLKRTKQLSLFGGGNWIRARNGYLQAAFTHEDYPKLVGDNTGRMRMCSTHVKDYPMCGKCFTDIK